MSNIYMRTLINNIPAHLQNDWCLIAANDDAQLLYNAELNQIKFEADTADYHISIKQSTAYRLLFNFEMVDLNGTKVCYLDMNNFTFVLYPIFY